MTLAEWWRCTTLEMRATNRGITIHELFEQTCPGVGDEPRPGVVLNCCPTPSSSPARAKYGSRSAGPLRGQYLSVRTSARDPGRRNSVVRLVRQAQLHQSANRARGWPADRQELIDLHGGTFTLKSTAHRHE